MDTKRPIIVLLGPTASGKSDMAICLAKQYRGEIICADSRTVYKEMDIGTAKPTLADRQAINHYCLDLVSPNQRFSAADFKNYANEAVEKIYKYGKIPFIVGGSGLYIDGLVYNFDFSQKSDPLRRAELEAMDLEELETEASKIGITKSDINFKNKRHLARAIERGRVIKNKKLLPKNILLIGIKLEQKLLHKRIEARIEQMLGDGLIGEAKRLVSAYSADAPGLSAPGYKALGEYINGSLELEKALEKFVRNDKNLAKRQMTWFKKDQNINWINNYTEAEKLIADFLTKFDTIAM